MPLGEPGERAIEGAAHEASGVTIHAAIARPAPRPDMRGLVTAAARCWRKARDEGAPVQQRLHAMLSPHDGGMLAPVFDSLMALCEAALGRAIAVGDEALSTDESLLLGLLDGSIPRSARIGGGEGIARALDCAIRSTRTMMILTMGAPARAELP
jgi:hypothetical protein